MKQWTILLASYLANKWLVVSIVFSENAWFAFGILKLGKNKKTISIIKFYIYLWLKLTKDAEIG